MSLISKTYAFLDAKLDDLIEKSRKSASYTENPAAQQTEDFE